MKNSVFRKILETFNTIIVVTQELKAKTRSFLGISESQFRGKLRVGGRGIIANLRGNSVYLRSSPIPEGENSVQGEFPLLELM